MDYYKEEIKQLYNTVCDSSNFVNPDDYTFPTINMLAIKMEKNMIEHNDLLEKIKHIYDSEFGEGCR